jgi:hypothetical protein
MTCTPNVIGGTQIHPSWTNLLARLAQDAVKPPPDPGPGQASMRLSADQERQETGKSYSIGRYTCP